MSQANHLPLSLVAELLIKPALKSLQPELEAMEASSTVLPHHESAHHAVDLIPIMADPRVVELVLERLTRH